MITKKSGSGIKKALSKRGVSGVKKLDSQNTSFISQKKESFNVKVKKNSPGYVNSVSPGSISKSSHNQHA